MKQLLADQSGNFSYINNRETSKTAKISPHIPRIKFDKKNMPVKMDYVFDAKIHLFLSSIFFMVSHSLLDVNDKETTIS
jgi:hypothetical protein